MRFVHRTIGSLRLIVTDIEAADVDRAKAMRARRDALYGNIYDARDTDERWVGDLGEMCLDAWLEVEGIGHDWLAGDRAAGMHDFTVAGWRMDAKAVKRKVEVRPGYTAQITARHAHEPVDGYFFMTFHTERNAMWLLGAKGRRRFLREATYYGPGEWVHQNYRIREGHEIYNIEIDRLTPPDDWLEMVRTRPQQPAAA